MCIALRSPEQKVVDDQTVTDLERTKESWSKTGVGVSYPDEYPLIDPGN